MFLQYISTNHGLLQLSADQRGLTNICFVNKMTQENNPNQHTENASAELQEYLTGNLKHFKTPLHLLGTDFQIKVWKALENIPFGKTTTYLRLATLMGDAKAIRAVANAIGKNPILIVVPCHRVLGTDGGLTGYSGGLHRKKLLLQHENSIPHELFELKKDL